MPYAPPTFKPNATGKAGKSIAAAERSKRYRLKDWTKAGGIREQVMVRDGMVCQACGGLVIRKGDAHIDHIVAVVDGGGDELSNLRLLHAACHSRRTMRDNAAGAKR